jgi:ABC-2 type transport system ATP-binding protein
MPADEPAASLRALSFVYPDGAEALRDVDLDVPRPGITAVLGPNGSGKSTLLALIAGRLSPTSGSVRLLGIDPVEEGRRLGRRLSHVVQGPALDPEMTGSETLRLFATLYGLPRRHRGARLGELVESFGLAEHLDRRVSAYSGGLRQRLHLALGMVHDPEVALLDEPTSGLDPAGRAELWRALARRGEAGRTAVVATHDVEGVERDARRVVVLHRGRVAACGSPEELRSAHAAPRLTVRLEGPASDPDDLARRLEGLPGVRRARCEGDTITVQASAAEIPREAILAALVERRVAVTRLQLHPAGLSSAYFNLTGQPARAPEDGEAVPARAPARGRGRRQGRGPARGGA